MKKHALISKFGSKNGSFCIDEKRGKGMEGISDGEDDLLLVHYIMGGKKHTVVTQVLQRMIVGIMNEMMVKE